MTAAGIDPESATTDDAVRAEPRSITLDEFFPPPGHRYLTDERIEALRQRALDADSVTLSALQVMELVCDWRNMAADITEASR